jgi:TM2 domain-containing membrane protein YozV
MYTLFKTDVLILFNKTPQYQFQSKSIQLFSTYDIQAGVAKLVDGFLNLFLENAPQIVGTHHRVKYDTVTA